MNYIHPEAKLNNNAHISDLVSIGKGVTIEKDVFISRGVIIYGNALIEEGTFIGENCIIGHPQRNELKKLIKKKDSALNLRNPLVEIKQNCTIRSGSIIYSEVKMGANCQTGHHVMIREKTTIGNNTLVGTNTVIDGNVIIGENVSIQTGVYIPLYSKIGNHVFMGPFCKLTNDKYMMRKKFDLIGPTLEDYVSVGANSVILPGIKLKKNSIIGAGSVVTKDAEENQVLIGNPAKPIKRFLE
jgi:acetyltransferase-like isoleucine patch superfamily enzyme